MLVTVKNLYNSEIMKQDLKEYIQGRLDYDSGSGELEEMRINIQELQMVVAALYCTLIKNKLLSLKELDDILPHTMYPLIITDEGKSNA